MKWLVILTEAQLRAVEFAVFALVDDAEPKDMERHGYSMAAARRALVTIQKAKPHRRPSRRD